MAENMCCKNCKNLYKPENGKEVCLAGLWDREEDDFLEPDDDFEEYISAKRFCSDLSKLD